MFDRFEARIYGPRAILGKICRVAWIFDCEPHILNSPTLSWVCLLITCSLFPYDVPKVVGTDGIWNKNSKANIFTYTQKIYATNSFSKTRNSSYMMLNLGLLDLIFFSKCRKCVSLFFPAISLH